MSKKTFTAWAVLSAPVSGNVPLDVVYIKGEDDGAADVLSRWAYPAYLANPDRNLHGSDADQASWDELEQETAQWVDAELAGSAPTADPETHHSPLPPRRWKTRLQNG